ncbi:MAG TPA: HAMP domain-containing sensor histidine kinase, partial [Burkholderiaceae bacterium]
RLATRLLQLARIESGVALRREPVDLALLARLVAEEFGDARGAGRLMVEVHGEPAPVAGDLDAIGIALRNLIDNALKHAAGAARVTVRVEPGEIAVIDDGPGVPPTALATLVRPFVRGNVLSEGSGLGLAIVDTIARQSGGRLELRSPIADGHGFGARLRFDLPASTDAAPPDGRDGRDGHDGHHGHDGHVRAAGEAP